MTTISLSKTANFDFVEFQEEFQSKQASSRKLSDEIVETRKKEKDETIDWERAPDPSLDMSVRYVPHFDFGDLRKFYPRSARKNSMPKVFVSFTMLITADGKIIDVRIRNIRSRGGAHKPFQAEFIAAARKLLLHSARLQSRPYQINGIATAFKWDSRIIFTLE